MFENVGSGYQRRSTGELRQAAKDVLRAEGGPMAYADAIALLNRAGLAQAVQELRTMKHSGEISMRLESDGEGGFVHVVEVND